MTRKNLYQLKRILDTHQYQRDWELHCVYRRLSYIENSALKILIKPCTQWRELVLSSFTDMKSVYCHKGTTPFARNHSLIEALHSSCKKIKEKKLSLRRKYIELVMDAINTTTRKHETKYHLNRTLAKVMQECIRGRIYIINNNLSIPQRVE
ncbi:hypothetical protein GQX74_013474 [Glossina fuscipes]|nr:hypothetical protein GQX74_013474 [Glossina fuscipes]